MLASFSRKSPLDCEPIIYDDPSRLQKIFGRQNVELCTTLTRSFGLQQLRILLYIVVVILLVRTAAQLMQSSQEDSMAAHIQHAPAISYNKQDSAKIKAQDSQVAEGTDPISSSDKSSPRRLLLMLRDDLHILARHNQQEAANLTDAWWSVGEGDSGKYVTVTNYVRALKSPSYLDNVTLTTHTTIESMNYTVELCKRWDGPISVAVFCPGPELTVAVTLIKYMRQCLPEPVSTCIRDKVTWQMVYDKDQGPPSEHLSYPETQLDSRYYSSFANGDQCPEIDGFEPVDIVKQFEKDLRRNNKIYFSNYREQFDIPNPINVLRNTARQAAKTKYVLAQDIELYPSANLEPMFIKYIKEHDVVNETGIDTDKFVFTLPIFEVESNVSAPATKEELVELFDKGDAVFFHQFYCDLCESFPHRTDWLRSDKFGIEDYHASEEDGLVVFDVTLQSNFKQFLGPVFIGTNEDPLYYEPLTSDGGRDRMASVYSMCLEGYHLLVSGNAFLVHAPGIKRPERPGVDGRYSYIVNNNRLYHDYIDYLRRKHSNSIYIKTC